MVGTYLTNGTLTTSRSLCFKMFHWHPYNYENKHLGLFTITLLVLSAKYKTKTKVVTVKPCLWNGMKRLCYLFARKFYPEALHNLMQLFSNYTLIRDTSA
ncbi:unnamed protein product [Musa acuminata subsp. burmannicoides]